MSATPIRCSAAHPDDPRRICRARLLDAVPETVDVRTENDPPAGCVAIQCPRCRTTYVVCARLAA